MENNADEEEKPEEEKPGVEPDDSITANAGQNLRMGSSQSEEKSQKENQAKVQAEEVDCMEDMMEDDEEQDADLTAKPRKCRLVCKECGKTFDRREMFNLHRHFHAHEDELTPLTCKECGLTFKQRSSLIKHRSEHKARDNPFITPKTEAEGGCFQCAECETIFRTVQKLRDHNCCSAVEKPYHCPLCRKDFLFKVSITKHMMSHSQENYFTCQECSLSFPTTLALRLHQQCHTALKPYKCPECGMVFKHYSVMEDHRRKHTDTSRSNLCNICGKTFKYSSLLHQHQYLHTGQKPFRCPDCGKKFAFAQNMKAHCRQHRLQEETGAAAERLTAPEPIRGLGKENAHQSTEQKRVFNCPLCPQTFSAPASLRAHMLIHEAEYETLERTAQPQGEDDNCWDKGLACPHCPAVYRDESSLNLHLSSVHKPVAPCIEKVAEPPKKEFAPLNSDNMLGRWSDMAGVKSYKCSECGKTFRHRSVLELHMRIHSKDKPYQCKVCGKGFRFGSYLQQHVIIHTGEKPYKCPDCGKDFAFLQNMKTHQRLHQEKPFRCTSCRKGYSDETQLQQHMLSHNGEKPHKCDLCDKSFGLAYLLRDHMNTHTGERPHRCEECHKSFSWFSSLLVHQKIHTRKRLGHGQYNSLPLGVRVRGKGGRGRRAGRFMWGSSRQDMVDSQPPLYPAPAVRDAELQSRAVQPQSSTFSSQVDARSRQPKEAWLDKLNQQPVQWQVDGSELRRVPSSQQQQQFDGQAPQGAGWTDSASTTQSGLASAQKSESSHTKESPAAAVVGSLLTAGQRQSTASESEQQKQPKNVSWSSTPSGAYIDGAALWSVRPATLANPQDSPNKSGTELQLSRWSGVPVSPQKEPSTPKKEDTVTQLTVIQPEKPRNGCELQKPQASGSAGASTSAQIDQSSAVPIATPVSLGVAGALWDNLTPAGIPKTKSSPEKIANNQDSQPPQKQVSPGWAKSQTVTQKVPIIQYDPHRFGPGIGTPVWGFQSNPVGAQTVLTGPLKPGNGQELQQKPMVSGTQIIISQPHLFSPQLTPLSPPIRLPGSHPLHSVTLSRPSHPNIFFTPQAVIGDRPLIPQTLTLPQLPPRTEPPKMGPRLPFGPERLLQCMICGCSLPREVDLQMHYMQHAKGEI